MLMKWLEEYKSISERTQFISQLAAFIISLFSILSLYTVTTWFYSEDFQSLNEFLELYKLPASIIFQVTIAMIFAARFSLFFCKTERRFWLNQTLLGIGLTLLISFWFISRPPDDLPFRIYDSAPSIFRHASRSFNVLGWFFVVLSPVKEVCVLIIALIKLK